MRNLRSVTHIMPPKEDSEIYEPLDVERVVCDCCTQDVFRGALWDHLLTYYRYLNHSV